ncbi:hypothetical protein CRM22_009810 [Opisthorchis felineus]|uniref:Uncharacterized protein n=1 Tax=Opisthorchis felineus TaxID=147828 RepID=A0A4S2LC77_OPIFE|nr:hypothetical protein CRM22_009810 [Opisthorchis felineus]
MRVCVCVCVYVCSPRNHSDSVETPDIHRKHVWIGKSDPFPLTGSA